MCLPRWSLYTIGVWAKGSWKWFQPGFQDHNHRQISRNESGDKHFSCSCGYPEGLSPGMLTLGCWEVSLPRMKGILTKKGSFLDTKVEPE